MRFEFDEPVLFKATQDFIRCFEKVEDPVLRMARRTKTVQSQIAWTLLGSALFQDRDYPDITDLLVELYKAFPEDKLWTLPVPKGAEIEEVVERTFGSRNWSLFPQVSGIFWSVGLFVRHHPDLELWLKNSTLQELWRDLGEIYFMGKSNPRPKVCAALFRLTEPSPLGLGLPFKKVDSQKLPLPLTMGARRYLAFLGPAKEKNFADMDPVQKQRLAQELFESLCPENPYLAAHSLQFYLERGVESFICKECSMDCLKCPVYEFCSYSSRRPS